MKLIFLLLLLSQPLLLAQRTTVGTTTVSAAVQPFGIGMFNASSFQFVSLVASNVPSGNLDLYTVPAGFRGTYLAATFGGSTNATTITYYPTVLTNGTRWRISSNSTITTNSLSTFTTTFVYDANETVAWNFNNTGLNLHALFMVWPTNIPIYSSKVFNPGAGNNTVYTVPAGKTALPVGTSSIGSQFLLPTYVNDSGVTRTTIWYFATTGQAIDQLTLFRNAQVGNLSISQLQITPLASGSSITLNLDAGTTSQIVWVSVFEI